MNKTPIIAIALLLGCLAGCDDAAEPTDVPPAPAKTISPAKPAAPAPSVTPKPLPEPQEPGAEYLEDTPSVMPLPPIPDRDAEQYDYDADMPPPEENHPMLDFPEDGNDDEGMEGMEEMEAEPSPTRPAPK